MEPRARDSGTQPPPPTCRRPREAQGAGGAESGRPSARRGFKYRRLAPAANQRATGGGTHGSRGHAHVPLPG